MCRSKSYHHIVAAGSVNNKAARHARHASRQLYSTSAASPLQCAIPGIVVDAKEVAPRLASGVNILYLAQGMLVSEHTTLEVIHQGFVAPKLISGSGQRPTEQSLPQSDLWQLVMATAEKTMLRINCDVVHNKH